MVVSRDNIHIRNTVMLSVILLLKAVVLTYSHTAVRGHTKYAVTRSLKVKVIILGFNRRHSTL